jgi:hypothetical protein
MQLQIPRYTFSDNWWKESCEIGRTLCLDIIGISSPVEGDCTLLIARPSLLSPQRRRYLRRCIVRRQLLHVDGAGESREGV